MSLLQFDIRSLQPALCQWRHIRHVERTAFDDDAMSAVVVTPRQDGAAETVVELEPVGPTSVGLDRAVYMFAPNPGEPSRPLRDIASTGETARVMLAVKAVVAAHDATPVLVFDEIDSNIGGEVGRAVGEKLRTVAAHHQVVAITHLPQSAVYGDRHFAVAKAVSGGRTRSGVTELAGEARVAEIARMLGGTSLTSVVEQHARELLAK